MVQFSRVPYSSDASYAKYFNNFQIILHEGSNDIQVNYLEVTTRGPGKDMAYAGIEDVFGNRGLRYGPMSESGQYRNLYVRYYSPESAAVEVPSKPALVSPRTVTADTQPTYRWNKVDNASRYLLTVSLGANALHQETYDSGVVCSGTTCSVRPAVSLADKSTYSWNVYAINDAGQGPVSDTWTFTVQVGADVPVTPSDPTASSAVLNNLYFPHVVSDGTWETEIAIINTSTFKNLRGEIRSYSALGEEVSDPVPINLVPLRKYQATVGTLSGSNTGLTFNPGETAYMVFYGDSERMVGYSRSGVEGLYRESVPAVLHRNANRGDIFAPHIVSNGSWKNDLILLNTESSEKTLTLEFAMKDAEPVAWEVTLQGGEKKILNMSDLVSDPVFQGGQALSAVIRQDPEDTGAIIALALFEKGTQLGSILLTDRKETELVYPHIPNHTWITGIVLFNPGESEENVAVTAYDKEGNQIDEFTLSVAGGANVVTTPDNGGDFILPPETAWFRASSSAGLSGCEFFGLQNGTQFTGINVNGLEGRRGIFPIFDKLHSGNTVPIAGVTYPQAGVTGISLVNPAGETASVKMEALRIVSGAWEVFASAEMEIPAYGKRIGPAETIAVFIDKDGLPIDISGAYYLRYESDRDLVGFQVNSSQDGTALDAVPALGGELLYDELTVGIASSTTNMTFYEGKSMTLTGVVEDPGGFTSGNENTLSYTWSSSLDGILGEGMVLDMSSLSLTAGEHRITLEVVHPESGARGSAFVTVTAKEGSLLPM